MFLEEYGTYIICVLFFKKIRLDLLNEKNIPHLNIAIILLLIMENIMKMPKVKKSRMPPQGYELVKRLILELENKVGEAVTDSKKGKANMESLWPIFNDYINYQRTRLIFDMYFRQRTISEEVYNYCIEKNLVDEKLLDTFKNEDN